MMHLAKRYVQQQNARFATKTTEERMEFRGGCEQVLIA
jgi:hypothetical protein